MKKENLQIFIFVLVFFLFLLSGIILGDHAYLFSASEIYYPKEDTTQSSITIKDLDIPLPIPSKITYEKNNIRLDLEKIAVNKYFIIYSVIYGNQSHTAYHLYLTNLNQEKIDKSEIQEVYLLSKDNEIIRPTAEKLTIRDFPQDIPLEWKVKVIAKFPYQNQRDSHDLILIYQGQEYILQEIAY